MKSAVTTVRVGLDDRGYDIEIGPDLLADAGPRMQRRIDDFQRCIVISDANVAPLYAETLIDSLQAAGVSSQLMTIPAGEPSKSVEQATNLWNQLLAAEVDRQTVIIALGGGVVGDLAGFLAATYARGLKFVQIPTTLLATVDSSVGGKVGINLPGGKNIIGAFWQPQYVLIDLKLLDSLPIREARAGMAEVIKYGVIADAEFFTFLESSVVAIRSHALPSMRQIVATCCQIKADVVEEDERETSGHRAILNYGHTFGHAIESATKYEKYLHGEAIAIGMTCAARLSVDLGRIDDELLQRQTALFQAFELPTEVDPQLSSDDLLERMRRDKKAAHGSIRLVLPSQLGHVELVDNVPEEKILSVL